MAAGLDACRISSIEEQEQGSIKHALFHNISLELLAIPSTLYHRNYQQGSSLSVALRGGSLIGWSI